MFGNRSGSRIVGEPRRPTNSGPQNGPNASTSKLVTRPGSHSQSSVPSGRSSLANGASTPTRQNQSAGKRVPSRQGSSANPDSISVLTQQASIATAALRREQAAFNGSGSRTVRSASVSPVKSSGPLKPQDARAQSLLRDSTQGRRSGAGSSFASSGPHSTAQPGRTVSPPKASKVLLGKAHTSAAVVSKILQIAQQSEQHQSLPSLGPRQDSPVDSTHQRWSSTAQVENQRATYPGTSAVEDETDTSMHASEHSGGPPALYSSMPSTSLSTPGNVPGVHAASRPITSSLRTQAGQRLPNPEADIPRVFATQSGAAAKAEEANPARSMQQRASTQQRNSADRQPSKPVTPPRHGRAFSTYGRSPEPARAQGPRERSKSTVPSQSPSRSPVPSKSPTHLPGSHSAAAVARRQQRIAQQLEANPPPPPEEIVPIGTGKKLSMAKLAELSKPKPQRVPEPEPLPPKPAPRRPSRHSQSPSKAQQQTSTAQRSQSGLQKSPSKIAQLKTTGAQSKLSQLQTKATQPPSKLVQPQSKITSSSSNPTQSQSKIAQLQTKTTAPQSKLAQPGSKLSQLRRPGQAGASAGPSPELQAILDKAKEAQEQLVMLTQVKDVTHGAAASEPHVGNAPQSGDPDNTQSQATGTRVEASTGEKADHPKKPSGLFGAFSSLLWKPPAASPQDVQNPEEAVPKPAEPVEATVEVPEPTSAEDIQHVSEKLPAIIDLYHQSVDIDATAESAKSKEQRHSAEHFGATGDLQQMHTQEYARPAQALPASATAPFATEDTPVQIVTSITRPSQNAVLPQHVFDHHTSHTMKERHLLSLPVQGSELSENATRAPISARRPHPMEAIRFLQEPQTHALVASQPAAHSSHHQNAAQPVEQDLIRLDTSPLGTGSAQLQGSQQNSSRQNSSRQTSSNHVMQVQDEAANLLYPGKATSAALSNAEMPQRKRSALQSGGHASAYQDEVGQLLYPGKKPSSSSSTKLKSNSNTLDAPSGVLTPVPVSLNQHPSHAHVPSNGSFMLPNLPMPTTDAAVPIAQILGSQDAQSESKIGEITNQPTAESEDHVPVLYSIAPHFKQTAFLPSSNDSSQMHPSTGANSLAPSPGTSTKLHDSSSQAQQQIPQVPVSGLPDGNVLDAPVPSGSGAYGRRKASHLSELQPGLSPLQQAMQKRAQVGLKADLEKQIAEKKRKEAEEKAAKRAEDTQEERKALTYLSTQAAHLETRAMSPLVGGAFPQGPLPEGLATSTSVAPGTRPSCVDLTRPERPSFGTNESLQGSPTRHLRGASHGSWSGPMGPAGSIHQPGQSDSLSSFGAGDSSAQDPHMAALNTVLGVDFIQDAPARAPGAGPDAHTARPHAPTWAPKVADTAEVGATALPDLLREVQEDRMRLQAQHAEQLAGFAMEPSDRLPDDPDYVEHHLRKNQAAAAQQLAYMEDLLRHPEKLEEEELEGTGLQSSLRIGGGGVVSPPSRLTSSHVGNSYQRQLGSRSSSNTTSSQQQKRPVGTWGTAATGREVEPSIRGSRNEKRTDSYGRFASPPTLQRVVSQDRLRTQLSTGHPLHTGMSRSVSPDTPGAMHSRRGSASPSPPPSAPSSRGISGSTGATAHPNSQNARNTSYQPNMRHNAVPSYVSQHSRGPSGFTPPAHAHSPAPSMGSSGYSRITRHGYSHTQDELVASSFLLPPSLDFVPDDPERVRLSEAAVSAFKSGRMRSASRARYPGTSPTPPEAPGNVYTPLDDDDEVRIEHSYPGSPDLAGDAVQHVHEGVSNPSLVTRRSSTSPLRHGFSKSISEASFPAHHHRHSTCDNLSVFDASADESPWGLMGSKGASKQPPNLLTQAAMQVLQGHDAGNSDSTAAGPERGRRLGRQAAAPHNPGTKHANGPGRSNTGSMTRDRSSTSLGSSTRAHSRQPSRNGSPGMKNGQGNHLKSRTPVGFGSGAPSSRAPTGLHTRSASTTDRAAHSASPARRVSNAGSLRTNEALVSRQQSGVGRGRISLRDRGHHLNTSSTAGFASIHSQKTSLAGAGMGSTSFGRGSNASLGGGGVSGGGASYTRGRR